MIADAIKDVSKRGGIVLDLFGGSGSTLIAAHKTGRRARLCELDPVYCDRILSRWETFAKDDAELIACGRLQQAPEPDPGQRGNEDYEHAHEAGKGTTSSRHVDSPRSEDANWLISPHSQPVNLGSGQANSQASKSKAGIA